MRKMMIALAAMLVVSASAANAVERKGGFVRSFGPTTTKTFEIETKGRFTPDLTVTVRSTPVTGTFKDGSGNPFPGGTFQFSKTTVTVTKHH